MGGQDRGASVEVRERTVDVAVGGLRMAQLRGRDRDPIRTLPGAGCSLDATFGEGQRGSGSGQAVERLGIARRSRSRSRRRSWAGW